MADLCMTIIILFATVRLVYDVRRTVRRVVTEYAFVRLFVGRFLRTKDLSFEYDYDGSSELTFLSVRLRVS